MNAFTVVLKNFSRRKGRAILNTIGLVIAIAVMVSTITASHAMEVKIGEEVEKFGPNIVVKPESQSITIPYGSVVIGQSTISETYVDTIQTITNNRNLRVVSPKLYGQITVDNQSVLVVGIIPEREKILNIWWEIVGVLPENESYEVLVGYGLKQSLKLKMNDIIKLNGSAMKVVGFLSETGTNDDLSAFIPLHIAQQILKTGNEVSIIDVGAYCADCPVEEIARQIMSVIPGVKAIPIKQAVEMRMTAVQQTTNYSLMLASIVLIAGSAGVMNTMLSSVQERKREIGVFLSLGADDNYLYKMFIYESILVGVSGGVIGVLIGLLASLFGSPLLLGFAIEITDVPLYIIPSVMLLSIFVCIIASLYPTWRATKIDPVQALKAV